jgi:hypothetical protein
VPVGAFGRFCKDKEMDRVGLHDTQLLSLLHALLLFSYILFEFFQTSF